MDEVVVPINGVKHWLWRAIDGNGDVLDILIQPRRNAKAARRFFGRLVAAYGEPRVVVTPFRDIAAQYPDPLPGSTCKACARGGSGQAAQLHQADQGHHA